MDKVLLVLHDPPYGTERVYNGYRWGLELARAEHDLRIFLFGDSVVSAVRGQKVPDGYYNTGKQVAALVRRDVLLGCCGTCMDARGIGDDLLIEGVHRSSMSELAEWTAWADKVINV